MSTVPLFVFRRSGFGTLTGQNNLRGNISNGPPLYVDGPFGTSTGGIPFFGSLVLPSRGERLFQGFNHWPGEPFPSRISWADSILFWGIRRPMIHYTSSHQSMGSVKNGCISNSTVVTFQAVLAIFYWTMIRGERVPFKKFNLFSPWMFSSRRVPPTWCCPMCHGHQLFRHHLQCFFFEMVWEADGNELWKVVECNILKPWKNWVRKKIH